MSGVVPAIPRLKFTNATGVPVVSGSVAVYLAGTNTLANTYQDKALTILNNNPVPLDGNGEALFWLDPSLTYKFLLKDANNATVTGWPVDNILGGGNSPTLQQSYVDTFSGDGSQTVFTLSAAPGNIKDTNVYVGGVYQKKSAYTLAGSALTFVAAPASGTNNIEVTYYVLLDFTGLAATIAGYSNAASASATTATTQAGIATTQATNAAASAASAGSFVSPVSMADYTGLRAYAGAAVTLQVTGYLGTSAPSATAGLFTRDDSDTTSADNGGTIIVASNGKRWKRTYSGKLNAKWFGAIGDGSSHPLSAYYASLAAAQAVYPHAAALADEIDLVAIQATVNVAIYNGGSSQANGLKSIAWVPEGVYLCSGPLHMGYGVNFSSVILEGDGIRYDSGTGFNGTMLLFTHNNAPGIAVSGSRFPRIRRMTLQGANYSYITTNNKGTSTGTDADLTASTWVDSAFPASASSQYAPYAAVAVDPYAGVKPATAYPDVSFPAYLGAVSQYGKNFSSSVTLEDVNIQGFVVGVANQPCNADGNGDFTKLNRVSIKACQYGLSIGNGQSRLVHLNDCQIVQVHTGIVTTKHGKQIGKPSILVESTEFSQIIKWVDIPNLSFGGCPRFVSCRGELVYSIGNAGTNSTGNTTISFASCEFNFTLQAYRGVPAYHFQNNGPGYAAFRDCQFLGTPSFHYSFFATAGGAKTYIFDGVETDTAVTNLYEKFSVNATGGISVSTLDVAYSHFRVYPSKQWNLDTGAAITPYPITTDNVGPRTQCLPACTRIARASAGGNDAGSPTAVPINSTGKGSFIFSTTGRRVSYDTGLGANVPAISQRGYGVGDMMYDSDTGATFRVCSRTGGTITLEAVSGYDSAGNLLLPMTTSGVLYSLPCRIYTPTYPLYANTTDGNAVASSVDRGDGTAAFIDTDIVVNDNVYYVQWGDKIGGENQLQITARDGATAKTITVNGSFHRTATFRRLTAFVRAEAPNG